MSRTIGEIMASLRSKYLYTSPSPVRSRCCGSAITRHFSGSGDHLDLGRHRLRFFETPHVHHWDSMMVVEETTRSLFPADLFLQPGDQPPIVSESLADGMCNVYRKVGIFAHEAPVRQAVSRIDALDLKWIHPMHGGSLTRDAARPCITALREKEYAYEGMVLGRPLPFDADVAVR
jgi:glyoxylase-like metal-dependent hydrolase (beta-lactamase superfamily II)